MPELLRIVTVDDVGRARQVVDLNNLTGTFRLRDSYRLGLPARKDRALAGASRYQGTQVELGNLDNGSVGATFLIRDPSGAGTAGGAAAEVERILGVADRARPSDGLWLEWRPDGLTRSVYFPLRGPGVVTPAYNVREWAGSRVFRVEASWPTAPLAEGLPQDLREDFRPPPDKPGGATVALGAQVAGVTDGDSLGYRWDGPAGASSSRELIESQLVDYTVDTGVNLRVRSGDVANSRDSGLFSTTFGTEFRLRHTGRGYAFYDGAVSIGYRLPDALSAALTTAKAGKIVGGAAGNVVYAWVDLSNASTTLYLIRQGPPGANQVILTSVGTGAVVAGGRYWTRLVIAGRFARAEFWTASPTRGGTPAASTAWTDVGAGFNLENGGEAVYGFAGGQASARVVELLEQPHTFADVRTPEDLTLRGIPGNAPARADLELGVAAAAVHDFGLIGWRRRAAPHNMLTNGDVAVDADGWTSAASPGLNAGGSFVRNATGGVDNGPDLSITSAAGATFTGAGYTIWDRFRRGRTYTVEFWAAGADVGNWQVVVEQNGVSEVNPFATGTLTGGAALTRYVATFVATIDATSANVVLRRAGAGAFTVRAGRFRVYEGLPAEGPRTVGQSDGRGAPPPFGPLYPLGDDASARVNAITATDAAAVSGQAIRFTGTTGSVRYLVDPELLAAPGLEAGDVDVEVYASLVVPTTVGNPRIVLSAVPEGSARRTYTREFGSLGKALTKPTSNGAALTRLGTLPLTVDGRLTGRLNLVLDWTATAAANTDLRHLFLLPVRRRLGSPSGKVLDSYYPTFAAASDGRLKRISSEGRGFGVAANGAVGRTPGVGGDPLELEPGNSEVALWAVTGANPDQPDGLTAAAADATLDHVHVRVTPRYRLVRDA